MSTFRISEIIEFEFNSIFFKSRFFNSNKSDVIVYNTIITIGQFFNQLQITLVYFYGVV